MATVSFQEEGPGCAAIGGPSIGSWGHCTMHLCTAAVTDSYITVYYPTKVDHFISYIYKEIIQTRWAIFSKIDARIVALFLLVQNSTYQWQSFNKKACQYLGGLPLEGVCFYRGSASRYQSASRGVCPTHSPVNRQKLLKTLPSLAVGKSHRLSHCLKNLIVWFKQRWKLSEYFRLTNVKTVR